MKQNWSSSMQHSNKGLTYSYFKSEYKLENYWYILPKHYALSMFRFRTSNPKIPVETGRWTKTPLHERICELCNTNEVGSEKHYLMSCPYFDNERSSLIIHRYMSNTHQSFSTLLKTECPAELRDLTKFMLIIMNKFR